MMLRIHRKYANVGCSVLVLFFTASCVLPGCGEDEWTVMSWNVQNLFDDIDHGTEYPEFDPGGESWSAELYQRRLNRAGRVVSAALRGGPDLLVLQELENHGVLEDLADGPFKGMNYHRRVSIPGPGIIRSGVLSRYPLEQVQAVDAGEWAGRPLRPALTFRVSTPGGPVTVIALHWKSPREGRRITEPARRLEARITADIIEDILKRDPSARILVIGDLNTPGDGAVQPAALAPWQPPNEYDAVLLRTGIADAPVLHRGQMILYDPEPHEGPPGTYFFRGEWQRPDRALLSPALRAPPGLSLVYCRIAAPTMMTDSSGAPLRWGYRPREGFSDHLPLVLGFQVRGEKR